MIRMSTPDPACPDCHGTGERPNDYFHECDGPLCAHEQPTIACECGDEPAEPGATFANYRPGVVL